MTGVGENEERREIRTKTMVRVGVTGGIGSGKSTVCRLFAESGAPVYDSDSRARELINGDGRIKRAITELLGREAYRGDMLDSGYVAAKVFEDKTLLASLNAIVHPAVALDFEAWTLSFRDRPYVVLESAILFESGFDRFVDLVIAVSAPVEERLDRVLCRCTRGDGNARGRSVSREDVMRRMANQLTDNERDARAWQTIDNSGSMADLAARVGEIERLLREVSEAGKNEAGEEAHKTKKSKDKI